MTQIYLDYNATTPILPDARQSMLPFLVESFGNPSSNHVLGREARVAVEQARSSVARLLGIAPSRIIFTSGGTESNNLAILGTLLGRILDERPTHIVISAMEHPATAEPAQFIERLGCAVTVVGCSSDGVVNPEAVAAALTPATALVSIMHANNEIGTIQPIRAIADRCREQGVLCHTDAAQSIGKIPVNVDELGVDLLSLAGHKFYAPKGIGALYVREGVELSPILHGAQQEHGYRPGTENVALIVALGAAAAGAARNMSADKKRMADLRDQLLDKLSAGVGAGLTVHGAEAERLPNTLSVSFPGVSGAELLGRCSELCASTGAACHSGQGHSISTTLAAIGLTSETARGTVRLSVGIPTTKVEIIRAADLLVHQWKQLRAG